MFAKLEDNVLRIEMKQHLMIVTNYYDNNNENNNNNICKPMLKMETSKRKIYFKKLQNQADKRTDKQTNSQTVLQAGLL